jgi:ectoine hydroxylase-related dioxygenase (phytanoyl-CoA dioxygenase family)
MSTAAISSPRAQFEADGLYVAPSAVIPADLVRRAVEHMDAVMDCKYDTGVPPEYRSWNPGGSATALRKLNDVHISDCTLHELITHPALGKLAAEVTGAKMVQVWATQLLFKPPSTKSEGANVVGWHQDRQYWKYWDGEVFTAWLGLSDVTAESGPMKLIRGSHLWGENEGGDFFSGNLDDQRRAIESQSSGKWDEVLATMPAGGVSFHHRLTVHGSAQNVSKFSRRSIAVHMRTEKSSVAQSGYYTTKLDDPMLRPIIYKAL